ncbi:hypothetical protein BH10BAC5_BH10BAC5_25760 [soil metagenome]
MNKLSFSGHETFTCKEYWLFKGYNFLKDGNNFNSEDSVVKLGVGKNMVASIRYWMKAFNLLDENDKLTEIANFIFGDAGKDQYLEDIGTNWLLHYQLISTNKASIYNLIFTEFRTERIEFTRTNLQNFLKRKCDQVSPNLYRESTINKDINIFLRSYISFKEKKNLIDEDLSFLFYELNLVTHSISSSSLDGSLVDYFKIENLFRKDIHPYIFLFAILNNSNYTNSINFNDIYDNESKIFSINKENTLFILNYLANDKYLSSKLVYTDTAGLKLLQFKNKPDKWKVLAKYYSTSHINLEALKIDELSYLSN